MRNEKCAAEELPDWTKCVAKYVAYYACGEVD